MEWLPLAQAALTVKLAPRRPKMVLRFIVTVEFMDRKMKPLPSNAESCFSRMISAASMTGAADESLPKMHPTSRSRSCSSPSWAICSAWRAAM